MCKCNENEQYIVIDTTTNEVEVTRTKEGVYAEIKEFMEVHSTDPDDIRVFKGRELTFKMCFELEE